MKPGTADLPFRNYHSPPWWVALFEKTRLVDLLNCEELHDGLVMWEDDVLYHGEQAGWYPNRRRRRWDVWSQWPGMAPWRPPVP